MAEKMFAEWFWVDRWVGSSAFGLNITARGLYREMLSQAWRRGAWLPNDHDQIRRVCAVTKSEWKRAWPFIERFWRVEGDRLVNDTQREVYREALTRMAEAENRGRSGARARWDKRNAQADAQAVPEQSVSTAQAIASDLRSPIFGLEREKEPSLSLAAPPRERAEDPGRDPFTDPAVTQRAGRFLERYADLYAKHRHGARYALRPNRDYIAAVTLCETWPDDRLDRLAVIFLTTDHKFAEEGSRTVPQFLALASWCDGKLAEHETQRRRA